ncbi:MAG: helix-turn-helix domain-containing protein [Chloroflexota bacterium]|nr:MAG: helix-turn-helix domain-containing protein [Chloroflexota bacterium]
MEVISMARRNGSNGLLTARQVARLLNVHVNTVRRWNDRGILKAYRIGPRGDRRFNKDDIEVFLAGDLESAQEAELVLSN